jgi:serine/threonine-protein kinase
MRKLAVVFLVLAACGGGGGMTGDDGGDDGGGGPYFPAGSFYDDDISDVAPVASSDAITANMEALHGPNGWGTGEMRIDFSIIVNTAPAGATKYPFEIVPDYYYPPECDHASMPLPDGGAVEVDWQNPPVLSGRQGYDCTTFDDGGDCHLLVHAPAEDRLYELYHATVRSDGTFLGGCQAIWDTSVPATPDGRGQQCTSADAAGYAIAPLLVTPEEVMAGEIHHAIRLILPNDIIRGGVYYPPATHGTSSTGSEDTLPYGGRMRLRADYPIEDLSPAAQVVARAMQTYGMMLADGGNIALTMSSDVLSDVTWEEVGLAPDSLVALRASDFDVIIQGDPIVTGSFDCERTPIED